MGEAFGKEIIYQVRSVICYYLQKLFHSVTVYHSLYII